MFICRNYDQKAKWLFFLEHCTVYCYRPSSVVVYWPVCRSVCHRTVSPAKTAKPIDMLFGMKTGVGPRNHVLDDGPPVPHRNGEFSI